jgi:inner membrane protein
MDNLTHAMVGAVIGQMGLKRKTGLGMAALIIGANIPDIDAALSVLGTQALVLRRGLTHGPLALLILPLILTGLLIAFDRWQALRGKRPEARQPLHPGWLFLLALLGTLSHLALDWLNVYGIRLLEPFSSAWFYGDTLFIIDVWLWALLIGGFFWSWRKEKAGENFTRPAIATFVAACLYVFANEQLSYRAVSVASAAIPQSVYLDQNLLSVDSGDITPLDEEALAELTAPRGDPVEPDLVVAAPVPFFFWQREILWRGQGLYGAGRWSLARPGSVMIDADVQPDGGDNPQLVRAAQSDEAVRAFLFWSRMPVLRRQGKELLLQDQRFSGAAQSSFTVKVADANGKR